MVLGKITIFHPASARPKYVTLAQHRSGSVFAITTAGSNRFTFSGLAVHLGEPEDFMVISWECEGNIG